MNLQIPIRPDYTVCVSVPEDITPREAWRISNAIQAAALKPTTPEEAAAWDAQREAIARKP